VLARGPTGHSAGLGPPGLVLRAPAHRTGTGRRRCSRPRVEASSPPSRHDQRRHVDHGHPRVAGRPVPGPKCPAASEPRNGAKAVEGLHRGLTGLSVLGSTRTPLRVLGDVRKFRRNAHRWRTSRHNSSGLGQAGSHCPARQLPTPQIPHQLALPAWSTAVREDPRHQPYRKPEQREPSVPSEQVHLLLAAGCGPSIPPPVIPMTRTCAAPAPGRPDRPRAGHRRLPAWPRREPSADHNSPPTTIAASSAAA